MNSSRPRSALAAVLLLIALTACGKAAALRQEAVKPFNLAMPPEILGLRVASEDVSAELSERAGTFYVSELALYSLREGEQLRATLQVSKFSTDYDHEAPSFQRKVITLLGSSTPQKLKVGDATVYSASGNQQTMFAWFRGRGFFVSTVHSQYGRPRTLVRELLRLDYQL